MPPPPPVRTTCPYCGVGCGVLVTPGPEGSFAVAGDPDHPANLGRLCSKGTALGETLSEAGRLLRPSIDGRETGWDRALDSVAGRLADVIARHGPDAVAFYVSGQLLTEDYYVANKLMKGFIGSGNIDTNSRLCMSSSVAAYKRAFRSDTVPCDYRDLEQADLIVLVGSNTAWCHPVIYQRIRAAKKARPGLKLIVIDPRRTATCEDVELHLALAPGTDTLLFNGLLDHLRREDALDWGFLEGHTQGFAAALAQARVEAPSIPAVAAGCGLPEAQVAEFFRSFARTERCVTLYTYQLRSWMGAAGIDPDRDVHLLVVPPPQMVSQLKAGHIDGFCVGEPWNQAAVAEGLGRVLITSYELWNNGPEKVFGVNQEWAEQHPNTHRAVLMALLEASRWLDAHENRPEVVDLISRPAYVNAPKDLIGMSMTGTFRYGPGEDLVVMPDFNVFFRFAANFPWRSHAEWFIGQMVRWGQVEDPVDVVAKAARVYRPDLYREAAEALGLAMPSIDRKPEGGHGRGWTLTEAT